MITALPTKINKIPLDPRWMNPGVVGIKGIDQSADRLNMGDYGCWYTENCEPSNLGWNNYQIGVVKRNTAAPINSKIQGIIGLGDYIYYVAGGNFYKMPDAGGAVTMPFGGGGIFDSNAKVRMVVNQGNAGTAASKIYACDGVNSNPRRFNPVTGVIETFPLPSGFSAPATVSTWQGRTVWTFGKTSANNSRILASREGDGDDYSGGSAIVDSFDDYVWPGDGDYIVGVGSIQFKGSDAQKDALIVCKSRRSFMGDEVQLEGGTRFVTFNNNGVDIGAISPDAIVQFGNDLWILTKSGIKGFNAVLQGSGGVAAFNNLPIVDGVNSLIRRSALSSAFSNSFAVHHAAKNKIRFFMPKGPETSIFEGGFDFGEIPNNYALCYGYGILPKWEGNPAGEAVWARGGAGFAFSCGCEHKGRLYLGDYFGNIYEMDCEDAGDDYIPLPGETDQPIYSEFQTPYMTFKPSADSFDGKKRILEIVLFGRSNGEVEYNFNLTKRFQEAPFEETLPTITVQTGSANFDKGEYGSTSYGYSLYVPQSGIPNTIKLRPSGVSNAWGVKSWFVSKRRVGENWRPNHIWIFGVTGYVEVMG